VSVDKDCRMNLECTGIPGYSQQASEQLLNGVHSRLVLVVPEKRFVERPFSLVISHVFYGGKRSRSDGALIFVPEQRGSTTCCGKMKTAVPGMCGRSGFHS